MPEGTALEDISLTNTEASIVRLSTADVDGMVKWSEEKKADFCKTFKNRSDVSSYILTHTADALLDTAQRRQFVGSRAIDKLHEQKKASYRVYDVDQTGGYGHYKVGGRHIDELKAIAEARAEEIFKNLPPLRQAVQLIKPEVAIKLDELESLKSKVKKYTEELEKPEYNQEIRLSQVKQTMTIRDFRKMVKERVRARKELVDKLNETAQEAEELEDTIAKELYGGIPEIQDAILDVAKKHYEQAIGLSGLNRRVEERVKFGDSDAAVELVKRFEKDEQAISPTIKADFDKALERLKLSAPQVRKAYLAAKKEKKS